MSVANRWLAIRKPIEGVRGTVLKILAFVIPLAAWCLVSYCPAVWHPQIQVTDPGESSYLQIGMRLDSKAFEEENTTLSSTHKKLAIGEPANPVFLPAPHEVACAFYYAFVTPPQRKGDPWLHQSLWHSAKIIFAGFSLAALFGVPLGVLCGTFDLAAKLTEPFVDFIRYMPAPVFGALAVAILGIDDGPKIAIIFIGTFFCLVLVVANTTRSLDPALLEAAQTLGTSRLGLIVHVVLPGIASGLYRDIRIMIGSAWTFLTIAELIGAMSGVSYFINQQGKYRHYDNVFAGIIMIGMVGFLCDQMFAFVGTLLFPWQTNTNHGARRALVKFIGFFIRGSRRNAELATALNTTSAPEPVVAVPESVAAAKAVPGSELPNGSV